MNAVFVQFFIFVFANSSFVWTVYYTKIIFSSILLSTNSNHVFLTSSVPNTGQFPLPSVITAPLFVTACGCCTGNFLLTNRYAALCSVPVPVSHTLPASSKLCDKPQVESRSVAARTVNLDDVCVYVWNNMWGSSWPAEELAAFPEVHCCMCKLWRRLAYSGDDSTVWTQPVFQFAAAGVPCGRHRRLL